MAVKQTTDIPGVNMEDLKLKGFRVHKLPRNMDVPVSSGRRDFYKMGLVTGSMTILYGDRLVEINGTALFFVNPRVLRSIVRRSKKTRGYACIFTEAFISGRDRIGILKNSPLFQVGDTPVIPLNDQQALFMDGLFRQMLSVYEGDYPYKAQLIKSCIELIIHEALRIQPSQNVSKFHNAASRISHLFMELLERQFPVEQLDEPIKWRTAQDFAAELNIHVNYLNRSVKEITGRTTSALIAERIVAEAKALLQHTDWSVADIAYALGFEYPTYFNNYFKRITRATPQSIRKEKV